MAPPQIAALASADAAGATDTHPLSAIAASLGAEVKSGKNRILRMLVRALNRLSEVEQALADRDEQIGHLKSLAMTDSLTGLMNRRGFEDHLRRVTASAERYDEQGVLVYIDLDDFKPLNDEIGHDAGDAVLSFVARFFTENVRLTDTVARLGGDEFAILMVQTDAAEGEARARNLQSALNASHLTYNGYALPISASMGVAPFISGSDSKALIRRADASMYQDKDRRHRKSRAVTGPVLIN
jgi:diguanylate cyclase (GGDEF)-like protein